MNIETKAKYTLFADDTTVFFAANTLDESLDSSLSTQAVTKDWFCVSRLLFNEAKTSREFFSWRGDTRQRCRDCRGSLTGNVKPSEFSQALNLEMTADSYINLGIVTVSSLYIFESLIFIGEM